MSSQSRSYEIQQRRRGREFATAEVTVLHEASFILVITHARPVVEALYREMNVFVGFQLEDGEAAIERAGQHVDHGDARPLVQHFDADDP